MSVFRGVVSLLALLSTSIASYADDCQQPGVQEIAIEVDTSKVVRVDAPKELFGFNLPWPEFQYGYFRKGLVRPELIEWLAPFEGASYRYPGGSPTNWFEWRKSIGPVSQRAALHAEYDRYAIAEFGLAEFADFVAKVRGRAVLTLNLVGPYKRTPLSPGELATDTVEMLNYVRNSTSFGCVGGVNCGLMALELGNELDWGGYNWPASIYIKRADAVISAVSAVMPEVQWVANGRTAPWDPRSVNFAVYNAALADGLADRVQAIAIHSYYDGISIPAAENYVAAFGKSWAKGQTGSKVFITEHARWPAGSATGRWESYWYQGTSVGGALSTADFLLSMLGNKQVAAANWHALGAAGPWQLVRWDSNRDLLYPSPVYWGLRTLREAYLDNVVQTRYNQPSGVTYPSGYNYGIRMVGMAAKNGQAASVLGINRNEQPYKLRLVWTGEPRKAGSWLMRTVSGASTSEDNTDIEPQKVTMKTISQDLPPARSASVWCVPAHAVFSIVEP